MAITAVCDCGRSYQLKDEFAGKLIACPACNGTIAVPASSRIPQADPVFDHDKFLIRQKKISISTRYFVGDAEGREIAYVHRPSSIGRLLLLAFLISALLIGTTLVSVVLSEKLFGKKPGDGVMLAMVASWFVIGGLGTFGLSYWLAPIRNVSFYRDAAMRDRLIMVRQDFKLAFLNANYTLLDASGEPIAAFRKNYLYNIVRRRWYVSRPDGTPLCVAIEDSILLSILRRFLGPMFGLLRTNFIFQTPDFERTIGEFNRKLTLFDKYVLDLTLDPARTLDRRIALAIGVMLDTGERR